LKWSILVLTQPTRTDFLRRLLAVLEPQVQRYPDVELKIRMCDYAMDLGTNRQVMIDECDSEYVNFVDDDDLVAPTYVERIYPLLDGVDKIGFMLAYFDNGVPKPPAYLSLRYQGWMDSETAYYRDISHATPTRRELVKQVRFAGGAGEDARWADGMRELGILKTEHFIEEILYYYLHRSKDAIELGGRRIPRICPVCQSTAVSCAGGMRNCNQCSHRW
jgi:hypothetical protein